MVRVTSSSGSVPEMSNGRGSPSEVFSPNVAQLERGKEPQHKIHLRLKCFAIIVGILCLIFLLSTLILSLILGNKLAEMSTNEPKIPRLMPSVDNAESLRWPIPSGSLYAEFKRAAVATDHGLCSEIGRDVLLNGGNAVDAAIASLICVGVVNPQSSGIGGGFMMTLYNASTERCTTVDARETAPGAASENMYKGNPVESLLGYKAIATPGEVHGFWTAFNKFGSGRINWTQLFRPSIRLAREGFPVSSNLAMVLQRKEADIMDTGDMARTFVDPRTRRVYEEGDIMKRERFAQLLIKLANSKDPVKLFYREGIAQTIAGEMRDNGGYMTIEDLSKYRSVVHDTPLESNILPGHLAMCGPPPPSSFAIMQSIVGIMTQFYGKKSVDLNDLLIYHRLIEAEKFAYAQRTQLGDMDFVNESLNIAHNMTKSSFSRWISHLITDEAHQRDYYSKDFTVHVPDHGTSHVVVVDHEGNGVSVTSTINQLLGAKRVSTMLGIVWNNEMDDFSQLNAINAFGFPPSQANFIVPRKRPMSSMSPTIVYSTNTGKVKMVIGASGGSRIISSVAQVIVRSLLFNQTIKEAIDAPRLHNQFLPHVTEYESAMPKAIIDDLKRRGQNMTVIEKQPSVVQALVVLDDGFIHANSDFRRKTATYPAGY